MNGKDQSFVIENVTWIGKDSIQIEKRIRIKYL